MDKNYTCIIFDLDGTISDSEDGILRSIMHTVKVLKLQYRTEKQLKPFIGAPLHLTLMQRFNLSLDEATEAVEIFRAYYVPNESAKHPPYAGMIDMLKALKQAGKHLAVATSKPTIMAEMVLETYGVKDLFDPIVGSNLDNTRAKKTEVLEYAISCIEGFCEDEMVMVGDKHYDILAAKALGIDSVGVLYGYGTDDEMQDCAPTYTVHTVKELAALLLK